MKRTIISLASIAAFAAIYITLSSNPSGPAHNGSGNRTGGPGSTGTCRSCHTGGATLTNAGISLRRKSDGQLAGGKYHPGALYTVQVSAMHASFINHGFQLMAIDANEDQAGAFQELGTDKRTRTIGGVVLVEHSQPLQQLGAVFNTTFEWMAPPSGTGPVTFHGVINSVNGDGTTNGDDVSNPITVTLTEDPVSVNEVAADNGLKIYPNPAQDEIFISMPELNASAVITVFSMAGQKVFEQQVNGQRDDISIPLHNMAPGTYGLQLKAAGKVYNKLFTKL